MNFTREPIIETIITPKEGYKLVIRNTKGSGIEEFFVDSVEVIAFGAHCFYRSLEKPKCFLVPVGDYEILEVREARMALKMPGVERGIKIGGGRETGKSQKDVKEEIPSEKQSDDVESVIAGEPRVEKKRERRRFRKKRGRAESEDAEHLEGSSLEETEGDEETKAELMKQKEDRAVLIPPPTTLISETIARYKDAPNFANAFYEKEEAHVHTALEDEFPITDTETDEPNQSMKFEEEPSHTDQNEESQY